MRAPDEDVVQLTELYEARLHLRQLLLDDKDFMMRQDLAMSQLRDAKGPMYTLLGDARDRIEWWVQGRWELLSYCWGYLGLAAATEQKAAIL